jgi:hypothetical protein
MCADRLIGRVECHRYAFGLFSAIFKLHQQKQTRQSHVVTNEGTPSHYVDVIVIMLILQQNAPTSIGNH